MVEGATWLQTQPLKLGMKLAGEDGNKF